MIVRLCLIQILAFLLPFTTIAHEPTGEAIPWILPEEGQPDLPIFWGQVNGHDVRIFFDTGGDGLSMSPTVAEKLRIRAESGDVGRFAGGKTSQVYYSAAESLRIGNSTFYNLQAMIIPGAEAITIKDVTIGVELLRRARILMDYEARQIIFLTGPFLPIQEESILLPFRFVQGSNMIVPVTINGDDKYLHFDTGATFALSLRRADARTLGLVEKETVEHGIGSGGQPVTTTFFQDTVCVCLGTICREVNVISLNEPDAMWDPQSQEFGQRLSGVVSHGFLSGLQVEYDVTQGAIWLHE
jgi:hypothetical protein